MWTGRSIRRERQRLCLSQEQLAARTGVFKVYLARIECGRATNPPSDMLLGRLERALGLGRGRLGRPRRAAAGAAERAVGVGTPFSAGRPVPVINSVAAGYPRDFTDLDYPPHIADEYVRCPEVADAQAFAARVIGDSMAPKYREGDIVVFSPNTAAHDGQACFVRFADTGETAFKAVYLDDDDEGMIRLQPLNPAHAAQRVSRDRINGLYPAIYRIERVE